MEEDAIDMLERLATNPPHAMTELVRVDELIVAGRRLAAKVRALEAQIEPLRRTLRKAADQFRYYERQHRDKVNADLTREATVATLAKAEINRQMAAACEAVLDDGA